MRESGHVEALPGGQKVALTDSGSSSAVTKRGRSTGERRLRPPSRDDYESILMTVAVWLD
jgi:hypothetical protein